VPPLSRRPYSTARRTLSHFLAAGQENLRLRTKLLLSFIVLTISLTSATLLVVRHNAEARAQQQIERDVQTSLSTFQVMQRQQEKALSRRADLLASLAFMRNGDITTIEDASNDPWQSDDCNLFLLTDASGKITAMHFSGATLAITDAQEMLTRSIVRGETGGWWFGGKNLYQVVLLPFYEDPSGKQNLEGYVVIGRLVDDRAAKNLARITNSEVIFRYGNQIAASTFPGLNEPAFTRELHNSSNGQVSLEGQRYYAGSANLAGSADVVANLLVLKSYSEVTSYLERLNHLLLTLGLITILTGGALIFVISSTVTRPLASLVEGVQALERGDYTYPLEAGGHDELSRLTRAFDTMRSTLRKDEEQREQLESQLRQAQKMEALGRLAGGVAHDFNNLLTVIAGHSDLMNDRLKPDDALHNNCQQIRKTAERAASLTRQLLVFSRKQVLQAKVVDLNDLVADMGKLLRRLVREDIELSLQLRESLGRVKADPGQLEQALLNLTVNASDAMPLGGRLTIETQNIFVDKEYAATYSSAEPGEYVVLSVTDTGHGMDAATKARIFEPFFTTKEPGKGTGLGLATVYGIVSQSGGFIRVESTPGKGTRFDLYLPKTNGATEDENGQSNQKTAHSVADSKTVLVVEDEREVRELACEFLKAAGFNVLTAQDGQEALDIAQRLGRSIDVVLTDIVMPRMRGTELGLRLKSVLPEVGVIYMTGYLDGGEGNAEFLDDAHFLQKPFSRATVVAQVGEALKTKAAATKSVRLKKANPPKKVPSPETVGV
jgi:signal transduction histidine kinase/ActR/RegA family two-component response regulator